MNAHRWRQIAFFLLAGICLAPFVAPPLALALGIATAFIIGNPFETQTGKFTRILLQASVVGLGFGMNLEKVIEAGKTGVLLTVATIFGTLVLGYYLGRLLKIDPKTSHLISSGTAICGGSAIAAVAPVVKADDNEISVALGTIFILNSIALFIFPAIGESLHLTPQQFGVWAAVAIHDTSSVVGAATRFGGDALQIATSVKLARALWIVPVAVLSSFFFKGKSAKIVFPVFILFFLAASVIRTYVSLPIGVYDSLIAVSKQGLTLTLFLIGTSLSFATVKKVGVKPFIEGVLLWIVISLVSLWAVTRIL